MKERWSATGVCSIEARTPPIVKTGVTVELRVGAMKRGGDFGIKDCHKLLSLCQIVRLWYRFFQKDWKR